MCIDDARSLNKNRPTELGRKSITLSRSLAINSEGSDSNQSPVAPVVHFCVKRHGVGC